MPVQRKVFRIEQIGMAAGPAAAGCCRRPGIRRTRRNPRPSCRRCATLIERRGGGRAPPSPRRSARRASCASSRSETERHPRAPSPAPSRRSRRCTCRRLRRWRSRPRVTRELDAVVDGAERATQQILDAAEDIEDAANTLSASLKHGPGAGARAGHPGSRDPHLRGLQFPGPQRPAHHQGARDAEVHRGAHRAHDGDLGRRLTAFSQDTVAAIAAART